MTRFDDAMTALQAEARPAELAGMARFGMAVAGRLGVAIPVLRRLARQFGRDAALAEALWDTGLPDAQILASLVADPQQLGVWQMDQWARSGRSWDVCDQACNNAFVRSPHAWGRVAAWATDSDEFVRRAAFSLLASLAVHDKAAADADFLAALPLVEQAADDDRNFVKKAVNWSLRNIGKRNAALNAAAIACAETLAKRPGRAARWIAADALRELRSDAVRSRLRRA
ncbi:MAG: DNA alkylation repair protein [Burkholderiales bacterium]|nr:DNA alkylation repair protein [Burkholderiales bacterium]